MVVAEESISQDGNDEGCNMICHGEHIAMRLIGLHSRLLGDQVGEKQVGFGLQHVIRCLEERHEAVHSTYSLENAFAVGTVPNDVVQDAQVGFEEV